MSFSLHYSPLLLILCAAGVGAYVWWTYRRTVPSLPSLRRGILGSLRFLTLFVILLLLFEPILRRLTTDSERPILAILYDNSASVPLTMSASDSLPASIPSIGPVGPAEMRAFAFDARLTPLPDRGDAGELPLSHDGERTDISAALTQVIHHLRHDYVAGVVLVSDGRYNTGGNPIYVAERSRVPIHSVVVGDTTARRDVVIGRIAANRVVYAGVEQPVEVELRAEGFEGTDVALSIFDGGARVASETLRLEGQTVQVPVALTYVPTGEGLRSLRVSVTELEGEITFENNHVTLPVRVLDQKRRALVLGGAPDPDVASVRQVLETDEHLDLVVRVQKSSGVFYEGDLPDDLTTFDVMVLVGYPGPAADRRTVTRVRAAIEQGVPVLFLLTRQTDIRLLGALGDALPVQIRAGRPGMLEAALVPTPQGLQHPIMNIPDVDATDWQRLPPLLASESRWSSSPDAQILAQVQIRGVTLDDPVLVTRARSGTRSVALLAANTWRWKNIPDDLQDSEHVWPSLLSNAIQWVTAAQDERPVRVRPAREVFAGNEPVQFLGEVYDERLQPVRDAQVDVEVSSDDDRRYPLRLRPAGHGRYVLDDAGLPEGTYAYRAVARRHEVLLGQDQGTFAVGKLALEQRETRSDAHLMRQIADRSGGVFLTAEEVDRLPDILQARADMTPRVSSLVREVDLWRHPFFFILLVLSLSAEWILRKRSGLV